MPKFTQPRKGQIHGPWSLILFVAFIGSAVLTVYIIDYGAKLIAWLLH